MKPEQSFVDAVRVELLEETGMEAREFVELGETVTFPTKGSERIRNFIGVGVERVAEQKLNENEEIEVVEFSADEIDEMILNGRINTALSITAWHLAVMKYHELLR